MTQNTQATPEAKVEVVDPNAGINLMSYESMKERLQKAFDSSVCNLFMVYDEEVKAIEKAEKSTVDWLFDLTAEGVRKDEIKELIESRFKEAGVWPLYYNVATRLYQPLGYDKASKVSLAGKIFNRIRKAVSATDLIVNEDGQLQFFDTSTDPDNPRYVVKKESNTNDETGEYTVGHAKGGEFSVLDRKIAREKAKQVRTVNPAEEKEKQEQAKQQTEDQQVQSSEAAKAARDKADKIGQAFGNCMKGAIARQKHFETRREVLAKKLSKADLEFFDKSYEQEQNDLFDLAEQLRITEKEGRYIVAI